MKTKCENCEGYVLASGGDEYFIEACRLCVAADETPRAPSGPHGECPGCGTQCEVHAWNCPVVVETAPRFGEACDHDREKLLEKLLQELNLDEDSAVSWHEFYANADPQFQAAMLEAYRRYLGVKAAAPCGPCMPADETPRAPRGPHGECPGCGTQDETPRFGEACEGHGLGVWNGDHPRCCGNCRA
jgi:hypothetical protein